MGASTARHNRELQCLESVLHRYGGVLTRRRLCEFAGADRWPAMDSFPKVLGEGLASGRLRQLGDELIEVVPEPGPDA